ncbi:calcium/sodium antiporter [Zavarzinia compransoris]|uniref:Sodium:calcium antiporter n=1 Tax=Zavarzinia compransoris TaxID=1264899 RepID=A0A317E767_9PROT|nr:calcium/sodium antiporter [Zavarzinia compransoris]PWR20925.1 sodium:calcium antiporter [Zavarzinia compransoris]TDP44237.1 cation:H+ antiporter [Zavarzinia compransoris]
MLIALLWCLAGLAALVGGAELIVRGGGRLAGRLGISPLIIGLTVVALGTSAPELAVGIEAAVQGNGSLAVGNIAGTNIVNILLILGLSAMIEPLALRLQTLRFDLPMMVAAAFALMIMAWDGTLSRGEGAVLTAAAVVYTLVVIHYTRRESRMVRVEFKQEFGAPAAGGAPLRETAGDVGALALGIAIVVVGADWLVDAAVALARLAQVSDAFIGLTIVAVGTSAPELVTTIVSTVRRERDIAIGNLVGSSIYNIFAILGITCLVPADGVEVGEHLRLVDIPVMAAVALVCVPVFSSGQAISRREGTLFVAAYAGYLAYLVLART